MTPDVIYMHRNLVSGKSYIGLTTKTITKRWTEHCYTSYRTDKDGKFVSNAKFHKAIRKYGLDTWEHLILYEGGSNMSLQDLEIYYIKKHDTYKNGYNSTTGGDGVDGVSARKGQLANRKDSVKGYYWNEPNQNYQVQLRYMGKTLNFGSFKDELEAKARVDYLMSLSDEELVKEYTGFIDVKTTKVSKDKGYYFDKSKGKYRVRMTVNGTKQYFGAYITEQEAINKVQQVREELGL